MDNYKVGRFLRHSVYNNLKKALQDGAFADTEISMHCTWICLVDRDLSAHSPSPMESAGSTDR